MGSGIPITQPDGSTPPAMFWRVAVSDIDTDGDGLTDAEEARLGSDPANPDTDGDGIDDHTETVNHTNPTAVDSDGDHLNDGEDADPTEILVNWAPTPESSYVMMEITPPTAGFSAQDLNDKGEVLFASGIWAGGAWVSGDAPDITGILPDSVSSAFPDGIPYETKFSGWSFFNTDRKLLQIAVLHPTDGPGVDSGTFCPIFWPAGQSSASLIFDTAACWDPPMMAASALGVSTAGDMAVRVLPQTPHGTTPLLTERIERYDTNGASAGSIDGTDGYHPIGGFGHGQMTPSGWVVSNLACQATATQPAAYKVGLWNASNAAIALPAQAAGWGYPVTASDLPNGKVGIIAGQFSVGRVFLPDFNGQMQYSTILSAQHLQLFAGDGTAMTDTHDVESNGQTIQTIELWRNGKLIPLRDLCPKIGELLDQGYRLFPLKANTHGMYLIHAEGPNGEIVTGLLLKVEFNLRNANDFEKGWDNTDFVKTNPDPNRTKGPWTSCGVNRTKADGTAWPNSHIRLAIPGCSAALGNLLELVPAPGSEAYVSLANQTIKGEVTPFDIQGTQATPANGCAIIVREIAHPENRSGPLYVHVFPPRVVKFQVYRVNAPTPPDPGFVATVEQIKTELNNAYNEQANIKFEELQPDIVPVNGITGVFNLDGSLTKKNATLLGAKIRHDYPAKHLRIILVQCLAPDKPGEQAKVGLTPFEGDWEIVNASVSLLDTYSHETGHSFNLASKGLPRGERHEGPSVKAPNGQAPLMHDSNGSTRWIRQEDWKLANTQADHERYGK